MPIKKLDFEIDADYRQFYLEDETSPHETGEIWTPEAIERLLATGTKLVAVGTARNDKVPVSVEIHDSAPDPEQHVDTGSCGLVRELHRVIEHGLAFADLDQQWREAMQRTVQRGDPRRSGTGAGGVVPREGLPRPRRRQRVPLPVGSSRARQVRPRRQSDGSRRHRQTEIA